MPFRGQALFVVFFKLIADIRETILFPSLLPVSRKSDCNGFALIQTGRYSVYRYKYDRLAETKTWANVTKSDSYQSNRKRRSNQLFLGRTIQKWQNRFLSPDKLCTNGETTIRYSSGLWDSQTIRAFSHGDKEHHTFLIDISPASARTSPN